MRNGAFARGAPVSPPTGTRGAAGARYAGRRTSASAAAAAKRWTAAKSGQRGVRALPPEPTQRRGELQEPAGGPAHYTYVGSVQAPLSCDKDNSRASAERGARTAPFQAGGAAGPLGAADVGRGCCSGRRGKSPLCSRGPGQSGARGGPAPPRCTGMRSRGLPPSGVEDGPRWPCSGSLRSPEALPASWATAEAAAVEASGGAEPRRRAGRRFSSTRDSPRVRLGTS
mmetsp:Transcript_52366/g.158721  ORF Transcript_52366/g.158721 Transcript_52366/m.158721 type:complete len:227 (+) Transcript_52366:25-705(+)